MDSATAAQSAGGYSLRGAVRHPPDSERPIAHALGSSRLTRHLWKRRINPGMFKTRNSVGFGVGAPRSPCAMQRSTLGDSNKICMAGNRQILAELSLAGSAGCSKRAQPWVSTKPIMASREKTRSSFPTMICANSRSVREENPHSSERSHGQHVGQNQSQNHGADVPTHRSTSRKAGRQ